MQTFSLIIIGSGNIGAFFDSPRSVVVQSHAHAFSTHPGFRLIGFVDTNRGQAERAAGVWGGEAFASLDDAFAHHAIDVAVVAVPDEYHYPVLRELVTHPLKLVFAEKPLATTVTDANGLVSLFRQQGIPLAVNYSRRYVAEFVTLRNRIFDGEFGRFLAGTGYYGKGTKHNGSHMVDLLRFLLGEVAVTTTFGRICDWRDDDLTCSAQLTTECGGTFIMTAVDCRSYTLFEMDLLFELKRVRLVDGGAVLELYEVRDSDMFAGFRVLSGAECSATGLDDALSAAVTSLYDYLTAGVPLSCTGEDGLRALTVCKNIIGGLR